MLVKGTKEKPHLGVLITFVLCCFCFTVYNDWRASCRGVGCPKKGLKVVRTVMQNQEEKNFELREN